MTDDQTTSRPVPPAGGRSLRSTRIGTGLLLLALLLTAAAAPAAAPAVGVPAVGAGPGAAAARQPAAAAPAYRWPLPGQPPVTRRFDPPPRPWLPGHRGVDLAGSPGAPVTAAGSGVVSFAGRVAGVGVVSVVHRDGLRTTYQPLEPQVVAGERLGSGDPIGTLLPGHPGCPAAGCLHWGLRRGETYLDPLSLLGLGRVRLLPHGSAGTG